MSQQSDVLLYDGDCSLCSRSMRFVRKRLSKPLEIIEQESSEGKALIDGLPEKMKAMDSVYLIMKDRPHARSGAAIRCLLYMKWNWKMLFPLAWSIPSPLRNAAYRIIASRRHSSSS
ncbi:MAG: DUF393 domain-containing protein [Candidatus Poseidoniaceae archaeon]|nr:DUF393 domain-containing protein [Candidatus Poseidoniaceae archaeon]